MKHSFLNFLSSALVPILCADIATGTSCNVHLCLIAIAAMRTFPNELAVGIRTRGVRLATRKAITADNLTAYVLDAPVERSTGCRGVVLIIENEYEEAALKDESTNSASVLFPRRSVFVFITYRIDTLPPSPMVAGV